MWEDGQRMLFDGITRLDTPLSETHGEFVVEPDSWETRETFSLKANMLAGSKTVRISLLNGYRDDASDTERTVNIDRIDFRDSNDDVVQSFQMEDLGHGLCGYPRDHYDSYYALRWYRSCNAVAPIELIKDDVYTIDIVAHQSRAGDESARMAVVVESDDGVGASERVIREKLVDLHWKLFGVDVELDSPDVNEAYELFFRVWSTKRRTEQGHFGDSGFRCGTPDVTYYDEFFDAIQGYNEWGHADWDNHLVDQFTENLDFADSMHVVRAWSVVLAFLMTDFRYFYF